LPSIVFYSELPSFTLKQKEKIRHWLSLVAAHYGAKMKAVHYIFCDDAYLLEINRQYLQHETLTDIITFRYAEFPDPLQSDIYISVERVRENASEFGVDFDLELRRVMVHGILHLLGFKDKTAKEEQKMRAAENEALALFD
jgi:rRNA maturation RNase YbeY